MTPGSGWSRCQPGSCFAWWCERHTGPRLQGQVRPPWSYGIVWSMSQRWAGRRQPGAEQVRWRTSIRCRNRRDGRYPVTSSRWAHSPVSSRVGLSSRSHLITSPAPGSGGPVEQGGSGEAADVDGPGGPGELGGPEEPGPPGESGGRGMPGGGPVELGGPVEPGGPDGPSLPGGPEGSAGPAESGGSSESGGPADAGGTTWPGPWRAHACATARPTGSVRVRHQRVSG
jgi:hypothetical protein